MNGDGKMKKVVGLIGSLRKESINRVVFNEYRELSKAHFEMVEGEIKNIPLYNEDLDSKCEPVSDLAQIINESDGVIFFSPEYNYSIPGVLKNALDWLSRDPSKPFDNKIAAIIGATPGGIGTARMQYHLRQVGVFLNINFLNKPEVMIGGANDKIKGGCITDQATKEFLMKHIKVFSETLK